MRQKDKTELGQLETYLKKFQFLVYNGNNEKNVQ